MNNEYEGCYVLQLPTVIHCLFKGWKWTTSLVWRDPALCRIWFSEGTSPWWPDISAWNHGRSHIFATLMWNFLVNLTFHHHFKCVSFVPLCPFKVPFKYQILMFISIIDVSVSPTILQILIFLGIRNSAFATTKIAGIPVSGPFNASPPGHLQAVKIASLCCGFQTPHGCSGQWHGAHLS